MAFSSYCGYKSTVDLEIGDRVRFKDEYGDYRTGIIYGRGAAGNYIQIESGGQIFEGYSSDLDLEII